MEFENIRGELPVRIAVIGLGGGGGRIVSGLRKIPGVHVVALDADAKDLRTTRADQGILIGYETCRGRGCEGHPERGARAAKQASRQIHEIVRDKDIAIVIAGLGRGTGTGGLPIIAKIAHRLGVLTLAVVTLPLSVEKGKRRKAKRGLRRLIKNCDAVLIVDNDKLREVGKRLFPGWSFARANELLSQLLESILETIALPSLINLTVADLRSIVRGKDILVIGIGEGKGDDRIQKAIEAALSAPLIDVTNLRSASGCLIHLKGGDDLKLEEVTRAGRILIGSLPNLRKLAWGTRIDDEMRGRAKALLILSGVESPFLPRFDTRLRRLGFEMRRRFVESLKNVARVRH